MNEVFENNAGKELIDATQEAVIDAVSDVGDIIRITTEEISNAHHEIFYQSPEFWVGAAFFVVVAVLYVPVKKVLSKLLQKRIEGVVEQIREAEQLRDEAREVLAEYEQKMDGIKSKTDRIVRKARKETESFKAEELKKFEQELSAQEKYTEAIIKAYEEKLINDSSKMIVAKASMLVQKAIAKNLSAKSRKNLIDESIKVISDLK